MKKIKQNLRDLLDFLTYFGDDFEEWEVKIESFFDYSSFKASNHTGFCVHLVSENKMLGFNINGEFGEIDLIKMDERIKLVNKIKKAKELGLKKRM